MARRKFIHDSETPCHVGSRCINKDWFGLDVSQIWEITSNHLYFAKHAFGIEIHAFVLMNNHFHLIVSAPNGNMSQAMAYFLRETSREITRKSNRINQTWGGRFFRSRLSSYHYFMHAYKYIYRNPVEAGICSRVEEYKYSTLNGLLGRTHLTIPVTEDPLLFDNDFERNIHWLNSAPTLEDREAVRKALKKKEFTFGRDPKNCKAHPLEDRLY